MPYRRLPNTDLSRIKALKTALSAGSQMTPMELPFSQKTFLDLKTFFPHFEQTIFQYKHNKERQATVYKQLVVQYRSARLYVSHFFQVVNFSILRGEIKPEVRIFYGLQETDTTTPIISTEQQLITWGKKLISGEEERILTGATRIYNPSLQMVKVKYEKFCELYYTHKHLQNTTQKLLEKVTENRLYSDRLITDIWNEVKQNLEHLPQEEQTEQCRKFGVVYFSRKKKEK
ncbi:MAG: hypothetical protein FWH18_02725 [Marinilabiliaceae bacterium]|nr:hypothetical protein [Marinilabiliaceae bacterium]